MKKKVLILLFVFTSLITCTVCLNGCISKPSVSDNNKNMIEESLYYILNPDGESYSVAGIGNISNKDIVIPNEYNEKPVTRIKEHAFKNNNNIASITISESITKIGDYAFSQCSGLQSIVIGEGVTNIGYAAFFACVGLTSITIPDSVTSIDEVAFQSCRNLICVTLGKGVKSIGNSAFYNCRKLIEVNNLSSLNLNKGKTDNGDLSYYAKNIYSSITGKSKLTTTDNGYIFYEDGKEIYLMYYIGDETQLSLPYDFRGKSYNLYIDAFYSCRRLTSVTVPDCVTEIGERAFWGCESLQSVSIGSSVSCIGSSIFSSCYSLESIKVSHDNKQFYSIDNCIIEKASTTLIVGCVKSKIPDDGSVKTIGDCAFPYNQKLYQVTIPNCINRILGNAFEGCFNLTIINFEGTKSQWKAIEKEESEWYSHIGVYTVQCTDGKLDKNGNEIE